MVFRVQHLSRHYDFFPGDCTGDYHRHAQTRVPGAGSLRAGLLRSAGNLLLQCVLLP